MSDRAATVWASTYVPSKSPFPDYGQDGYSVAWVDVSGERLQVLVDGPKPLPGTVGHLIELQLDGQPADLFVRDRP
jgi:hypothetical protein